MNPVEFIACAASLLFGLAVVVGVWVDLAAACRHDETHRNPEDWER